MGGFSMNNRINYLSSLLLVGVSSLMLSGCVIYKMSPKEQQAEYQRKLDETDSRAAHRRAQDEQMRKLGIVPYPMNPNFLKDMERRINLPPVEGSR